MRLLAALQGDLKKIMAAEQRAAERAVTDGVRQATDGLKLELRGQVTGAGLGQRLANTWRGQVFPKSGQSLNAAGFVFSKAPNSNSSKLNLKKKLMILTDLLMISSKKMLL